MGQAVDPSKVIQKLSLRIAHEIVQGVMNEVALEEANAIIAVQKMPAGPDAD